MATVKDEDKNRIVHALVFRVRPSSSKGDSKLYIGYANLSTSTQ